jgi:hypothetical protein
MSDNTKTGSNKSDNKYTGFIQKYTENMDKYYKHVIGAVWFITFIIEMVLYMSLEKSNNSNPYMMQSPYMMQGPPMMQGQPMMQTPMYPQMYPQYGGKNGGNFFIYMIPILIASLISLWIVWKYTKRSKCIAYFLTLIPIIPANRIYTGHVFSLLTPIRFIPFFGQIMDIVILYLGYMKPSQGWDGDGTCKLFLI